jgi:hypothetical protein
MPLSERIGLDDLSNDEQTWRFLDRRKLTDLILTGSLRLTRISDLRQLDQRESHLPCVMRDVLGRVTSNEEAKAFIMTLLDACENQAFNVFASCWFLPGTEEENRRMWEEFGGGKEGGVRLNSTLRRLASSVPTDARRPFGIGRIQYIREDISYPEIAALGEYKSMPFLMKLENYTNEREIRLFERFHRPQCDWDIQKEQPPCTRFSITDTDLIKSITISPICSNQTKQDLTMNWCNGSFRKRVSFHEVLGNHR